MNDGWDLGDAEWLSKYGTIKGDKFYWSDKKKTRSSDRKEQV